MIILTPCIFDLSGFSAMSNTYNLLSDPLRSWGSHWRAASREIYWWFPGYPMHSKIYPSNRSIIARGFSILTLNLPCSSWGVSLVPEGVHRSWRGSGIFWGSNSVLGPVFPFCPGLYFFFKVLILGLRCSLALFLGSVLRSLPPSYDYGLYPTASLMYLYFLWFCGRGGDK